MRPGVLIEACRASHRRLLTDLSRLADEDCRQPSRLPGYSRGHVIAHLVNKADAHTVIFGGPPAGEVRRLHPEGYDPDAAADAAAKRSAINLHRDLEQALGRLEAAWDALDQALWDRTAIMSAGSRTMGEIVGHHLRNVEVHHVDLDIGYTVADWSDVFVEDELAKRLIALPERADHAELLAWLLDRAPAPPLTPW
jgi:maleylpyruvate isomerase